MDPPAHFFLHRAQHPIVSGSYGWPHPENSSPSLARAGRPALRVILLAIAAALALLGLAYRFYALEIFSFIVPKDGGTVQLASGVPFGPDAQQTLDVYAPDGRKAGLPVLLFIHGGSWESGSKDSYEFVGRAFAAQGYLTLVANYRMRPGHAYPAFIADAALALAFAQNETARYGGDGGKVFGVGHSAGAYNLAQAVLDKRYLAAAGVDEKRIGGIATLAGPFDFLPLDGPVTIATFGGVPDLPSTQPVNYARADAPPFLLLTGTEDTTVYPRNSIALEKRLRELRAPVGIKQYVGIGHVGILLRVAKPFRSEAVPVLKDIIAFFKT